MESQKISMQEFIERAAQLPSIEGLYSGDHEGEKVICLVERGDLYDLLSIPEKIGQGESSLVKEYFQLMSKRNSLSRILSVFRTSEGNYVLGPYLCKMSISNSDLRDPINTDVPDNTKNLRISLTKNLLNFSPQ